MDQGSLRRVAVLLDSLDQVTASRLLSKMPPSRAAQVRYAISQLADVDPLERRMAIADFMQKSHTSTSPPPTSSTDRPSGAAAFASDSATAASTAPPPTAPEPTDPMRFLNEIPIRALVSALSNEHPQTVAIVLASMQPPVAAKLLNDLPASIGKSAIQRLVRISEIPSQALHEISAHLQSLIQDVTPAENQTGSRSLASILTHLGSVQREQILSDLATDHPDLAAALPQAADSGQIVTAAEEQPDIDKTSATDDIMPDTKDPPQLDMDNFQPPIDFSVIERLPADALRRVLMEVDVETAILSLCGVDRRVVQRLLATLPRNQSREVRHRLSRLDSVELRQIDEAQSRVHATALQLSEAGMLPELKVNTPAASRLSFAA